jgi:MerR family redox-sensitive transcriptional activator SoxR
MHTTDTDAQLPIGDVARAAGVSASAIRYYERHGLLPTPERSGGKRRYDERILPLLRVIEFAKEAGFSLREIEQLLHGFDRHTPPSRRWELLAEGKLREIDALIARAQGMRALLARGLECGCLTLEDCRLLAWPAGRGGARWP